MFNLKHKKLKVTMSDGTVWTIPVDIIAMDRAAYFMNEFSGSLERSLNEDTIPFFNSNENEVKEWAINQMEWKTIKDYARLVHVRHANYEKEWVIGEHIEVE